MNHPSAFEVSEPTKVYDCRGLNLFSNANLPCRWGLWIAVAWLALSLSHAQNHSQVFFDTTGTDQAAYAGNELVTISGNLTFYGRNDVKPAGAGVRNDFIQPASDIYIMRHGYYHGSDTPGLQLFLKDVNEAPNTILGLGGGGFFEQTIAATHPQGSLVSGDYDIIVDEHQNGTFEPGLDLYLGLGAPALVVKVPFNAPVLPNREISAMKLRAIQQYQSSAMLSEAFKAVSDLYSGPKGQLLSLLTEGAADGNNLTYKQLAIREGVVLAHTLFTQWSQNREPNILGRVASFTNQPFDAAVNAIENSMKRQTGLAADPPDPAFDQVVVLPPKSVHFSPNNDPWVDAIGAFAVAIDDEARLQSALLTALERYQGATEAMDGRWCLVHARSVSHFATLLAEQWEVSEMAIMGVKDALADLPFDLEAYGSALTSIQQDILREGLSPEVALALAEAGLPTSGENFLKGKFDFDPNQFAEVLNAKISANAESVDAFEQLALAIDSIVTEIEGNLTVDLGDPKVSIQVPEAPSEAGVPVALTAVGTDAYLVQPLIFEWDLNGDGLFDDAEGVAIETPFVEGALIGVRGTNGADRFSVAYGRVNVLPWIDPNQTPRIVAAIPVTDVVGVGVGEVLTFSVEGGDPDGGEVTVNWAVDGEIVQTGTSFDFLAPTEPGLRFLTAEVSDVSGARVSRSWMIRVTTPASLADLGLTMTSASPTGTVGEEFTWTITVENRGPSVAKDVVITQPLSAGMSYVRGSASFGMVTETDGVVTANLGDVEVGGIVTVWVQTTSAAAGSFSTSAALSSSSLDRNDDNNAATAEVRINDPTEAIADVALAGSVVPSQAVIGATQTLEFAIENHGQDLAEGVLFETQLPESVEFVSATPPELSSEDGLIAISIGEIGVGEVRLVSVTVHPTSIGSGTAFARVTSAVEDPQLANNETSVQLTAIAEPLPKSDLTVTQSPPVGTVRVGAPATWIVTVTNNGPDSAENVTVQDRLPAGSAFVSTSPAPNSLGGGQAAFVIGTVESGESRSVEITVRPLTVGLVTNLANATSDSEDPVGGASYVTEVVDYDPDFSGGAVPTHPDFIDPLSALGPPDATGNLSPGTVSLGSGGRIILRFARDVLSGSNDATPDLHIYEVGDDVEDTFVELSSDGDSWHSVGKVSGSTSSIDLDAYGFSLTDSFSYVRLTDDPNEGSASGDTVGADIDAVGALENGAASSSVVVVEEGPSTNVDLSTTITAEPVNASVGEEMTFTIEIANSGPDAAADVLSITTLPAGLELVSVDSSQGTASSEDGVIRLTLPMLNVAENLSLTIVASVTAPRLFPVVTEVTSADTELAMENNRAVSDDLTATVALVHKQEDPELAVLQTYLAEMGLGSRLIQAGVLEGGALESFELIIYNDLSWSLNRGDVVLVEALKAAADAGKPLYFIGDDLGHTVSYDLNEPHATIWSHLTHLQSSANGYSGGMRIINRKHPVTNGVFGEVGDSEYQYDTDRGFAVGLPGEVVLGKFGEYDSVIAFEDPETGRRSLTQNELVYTQVPTPLGQEERKKLFKNGVTWLLSEDRFVDLAVRQSSPPEVMVGETFSVSLTVTNRSTESATGVTLFDRLPSGLAFVSGTSDWGTVSQTGGLISVALGGLVAGESTQVDLILRAEASGIVDHTVRAASVQQDSSPGDNQTTVPIVIAPASSIRLMASYLFNETLAACEPDVEPLRVIDPLDAGNFESENVNGRLRQVYHSDKEAAFTFIPAGLLPADDYSIEFVFRSDGPTSGPLRLIEVTDFVALSLDAEGRLLIGEEPPVEATVEAGEFHHVVLTVVPGGNVSVYLNGKEEIILVETNEFNIEESDLVHFLSSDEVGLNREMALLRVYQGALPASRVAAQAAHPFGPSRAMTATEEFSGTANPNGVWTYGYSETRGTSFSISTDQTGWVGGDLEWWSGTPSGPFIFKNVRDYAVSFATIVLPPDLLNFDPSFDGRNAVLRWTAAASGVYRVQGRFQGVDTNPNGTDVALLKNGNIETTLFEEYVLGYESRKPFDVTVSLVMGETVDFSVGRGGNSNLYDSTGLNVVVTPLELTELCSAGTDLRVSVLNDPITAVIGEPFALTLNVSNAGSEAAHGVVVTEVLPAGLEVLETSGGERQTGSSLGSGSLSLGTLMNGETREVSVLVRPMSVGIFTHVAQIGSATFDAAPANNAVEGTITVGERIQLVASVRSTVDQASAGEEVRFEIVAANASQSETDAVLKVDLPPGVELVSTSGGGVVAGNVITFPETPLAPGATVSELVVLRPATPGSLRIGAEASAPGDAYARSGFGELTMPIVESAPPTEIRVTIHVDPTQPMVGCPFTVTYTLENLSPTAARNVEYTTTLPASCAFISATTSSGETSMTGRVIEVEFPEIVLGTPQTIAVEMVSFEAEALLLGAVIEVAPGNHLKVDVAEAPPLATEVTLSDVRAAVEENTFTLRLSAPENTRYVVQFSDDLLHWRTFPESFEASGVSEEWSDMEAVFDGFAHFYRVVSVCEEVE